MHEELPGGWLLAWNGQKKKKRPSKVNHSGTTNKRGCVEEIQVGGRGGVREEIKICRKRSLRDRQRRRGRPCVEQDELNSGTELKYGNNKAQYKGGASRGTRKQAVKM